MVDWPFLPAALCDRVEPARWQRLVQDSVEFRLAARFSKFNLRLDIDDQASAVRVSESGIEFVADSAGSLSDLVHLTGSGCAWDAFLKQVPSPPNHSILAMDRRRADFQIIGKREHLVRNLRPLVLIMDMMRTAAAPELRSQ